VVVMVVIKIKEELSSEPLRSEKCARSCYHVTLTKRGQKGPASAEIL
jgi:hypothetical protein